MGVTLVNKKKVKIMIYTGEQGYLDLLLDILNNGTDSDDRTGVGTRKVFGRMLKFDLKDSFPLLTTKYVWFKGLAAELLWMISGDTNIRSLVLQGVYIWNEWPLRRYLQATKSDVVPHSPEWEIQMEAFTTQIKNDVAFAYEWGDLGPVYGYQWRHWRNRDNTQTDQLQNAIDLIKHDPNSRRIIVMAWNPSDIAQMAISGLPPCHYGFQFQVEQGRLNCLMTQRSVDSFLGLPFNIAAYALLTYLVADVCRLTPGELTLSLADTHIYLNHIPQVLEQLNRAPYKPPTIVIGHRPSIDDFVLYDMRIQGYTHHLAIKADIAV